MDSEATGGWATWLSAHPLVHQDLVCSALLYFCWLFILPSMCSMCYFAAMDGEVLDALKKVLADRERQGTLVSKKVGSSLNREP